MELLAGNGESGEWRMIPLEDGGSVEFSDTMVSARKSISFALIFGNASRDG